MEEGIKVSTSSLSQIQLGLGRLEGEGFVSSLIVPGAESQLKNWGNISQILKFGAYFQVIWYYIDNNPIQLIKFYLEFCINLMTSLGSALLWFPHGYANAPYHRKYASELPISVIVIFQVTLLANYSTLYKSEIYTSI